MFSKHHVVVIPPYVQPLLSPPMCDCPWRFLLGSASNLGVSDPLWEILVLLYFKWQILSKKKILFFIFYSNLPSIISSKMCTLPPLLQKVKLITLYFLTLVKKCHYLSLKLIIIDAHTFLALYKRSNGVFK